MEYLFTWEKTTPRNVYFLGNYDWLLGIYLLISTVELFFNRVDIYGDTGTFLNRRDHVVEKGPHENLTLNTFQRNMKILIKTLTVPIFLKLPKIILTINQY